MNIPTTQLFDIDFSVVTQQQAVEAVIHWARNKPDTPKMVVTPNVNLTMVQRSNPAFRKVLNNAALCLVDGRPIYWASRWLNKPLPEVVTGSDLVPAIFDACTRNQAEPGKLRVFFLGAAPGVAKRAAAHVESQYRGVEVCGTYSPPFGFEHNPDECQKICQWIAHSKAQILIIGLGAPKQEMWADKHLSQTGAHVAICAGATIDFLASEKPRAPVWMRKAGLEWLFRLCSEPKRLAGRYWRDGLALPALLWQEYQKQKRQNQ
ncbi:MAG TPA: WecB/TagA/CpsF family glycosyltransferase [Limnobacter sp.]|nr:WecB/TagA/CpsF family glycosyltransferase [Limnobacter sp.]